MIQLKGVSLLSFSFGLLLENIPEFFAAREVTAVGALAICAALDAGGEAFTVLLEASTTAAPATPGVTQLLRCLGTLHAVDGAQVGH